MKTSIFTKILLLSLATIMFTIMIIVVNNVSIQTENIQQSLIRKGIVIAEILSIISEDPLYNMNITILNQLLSNLGKTPDIVEAYITDENKIIMAAAKREKHFITGFETEMISLPIEFKYDESRRITERTQYSLKNNMLIIVTPVWNEYVSGFVIIKFSLENISATIKYSNKRIIQIGFYSLIAVFFVASLVAFRITIPIKQLTTATQKIEQGEYSTRVSVNSRDEIFDLSVIFNKMAEKIEDNIKDLDTKIQQLKTIREISNQMSSIFDLDQLLQMIVDSICNILNSTRCSIMLLNNAGTDFFIKIGKGFTDDESIKHNIPLSFYSPIAQHIYETRKPLLVNESNKQVFFKDINSEQYFTNSFMSVPLVLNDKLVGIMNITNKQGESTNYTDSDMELFITFAQQVVIAIHNSELHSSILTREIDNRELEIARNIQLGLYPSAPEIEGFDIAVATTPAKRVGGDYYDFIQYSAGEMAVAIGDISGKGVPAAIMMAMVKSFIKSKDLSATNPETLVYELNNFVYDQVKGQKYLTLFFGKLDIIKKEFTFTNGGHVEPYLIRKNGETEKLFTQDLIVGLFDDAVFHSQTVSLSVGDTIVFYTDGITEAQDGGKRMYSESRMEALLETNVKKSARQIVADILTSVSDFRKDAEQSDDETVIVLKVI